MLLNEVVEEKHFMQMLEKLKTQFPRIYEIKDAIVWSLARNPKSGKPMPTNADFYVYKSDSLNTSDPSFWILYKFDPKNGKVQLYSLAPILEQDNEL